MVRRKCLDCPAIIATGSRCKPCQERYRDTYSRHGWADGVKARDGYRCRRCGCATNLKAHHIRPISRGGGHELSNGITLCGECHQREHGKQAAKA
jgi:5-methylcytosine-specific restriction endonuclease McrA